MADVKDRISKLGNMFSEMQVTSVDGKSIIYVIVMFPYNWIIDEDIETKFKVSVGNGGQRGQYYFCTEIENGFDMVFDAIDYNISKMEAAQERAELLTKKVQELKLLFSDETVPLESLRTLRIVTGNDFNVGLLMEKTRDNIIDSESIPNNDETNEDGGNKRGRKKK